MHVSIRCQVSCSYCQSEMECNVSDSNMKCCELQLLIQILDSHPGSLDTPQVGDLSAVGGACRGGGDTMCACCCVLTTLEVLFCGFLGLFLQDFPPIRCPLHPSSSLTIHIWHKAHLLWLPEGTKCNIATTCVHVCVRPSVSSIY